MDEIDRLRRERDLYRALLAMQEVDDAGTLVERTLTFAIDATGAERGLVELRDGEDTVTVARAFGDAEIGAIRAWAGVGIREETLRSGAVIHTTSAVTDPRFATRESVRRASIQEVVCAPLAGGVGVIFLQGRTHPGGFSSEDLDTLRTLAEQVAPAAVRLLEARRRASPDPTLPWRSRLRAESIIGRSAAIAETLRLTALVADLDLPVLLTGPTGTGKSALSRVIHDSSNRRDKPFVELNCAALPRELVESELFGAEPGAHSTATRRVEGKVRAAEGGTLFLDEIGELPMDVQAKLLQLLQSGTFYPLGSARPHRATARVITATNVDLRSQIAERRFREDLYYRIGGFEVRSPPLESRPEDIPLLADELVGQLCRRHGLPAVRLDPYARASLQVRPWPGNVRELENVLQRAVVIAAGERSPTVQLRHLDGPAAAPPVGGVTFADGTRAYQRALLAETLASTDGNVSEAARRLGLTRSHTYNLLHAFGLSR